MALSLRLVGIGRLFGRLHMSKSATTDGIDEEGQVQGFETIIHPILESNFHSWRPTALEIIHKSRVLCECD